MGLPQHIPVVFPLCAQAIDHFDGKLSRLAVVAGQCTAQDSAHLLRPLTAAAGGKGTGNEKQR